MNADTQKIAEIHGLASAMLTAVGTPGATLNLPWLVVNIEAVIDRCNSLLLARVEEPSGESDLQKANSKLEQWEALFGPVIDFAQSNRDALGLKLGESISGAVLGMLKEKAGISATGETDRARDVQALGSNPGLLKGMPVETVILDEVELNPDNGHGAGDEFPGSDFP